MLSEDAKRLRAESQRKYAKANPDKIHAHQKKYRETHRKQINQMQREWRKKNPDKVKAYTEAYWERKAEQMKNSD